MHTSDKRTVPKLLKNPKLHRRIAGRGNRPRTVPSWVQDIYLLELERIRISHRYCRRYGHSRANLDGYNLCRRCGEGLHSGTGEPTGRLGSVITMHHGNRWRGALRSSEAERRRGVRGL